MASSTKIKRIGTGDGRRQTTAASSAALHTAIALGMISVAVGKSKAWHISKGTSHGITQRREFQQLSPRESMKVLQSMRCPPGWVSCYAYSPSLRIALQTPSPSRQGARTTRSSQNSQRAKANPTVKGLLIPVKPLVIPIQIPHVPSHALTA